MISAALLNSDGTHNVYITADPTVNALTLTLTNGLSEQVVMPPGTPVAYGDLPSDQSAVYIFLNGLLGNADIAAIALAAQGWQAGTFTDQGTGLQYLVIAPASQVTVAAGGTLTFTLANVLTGGQPRSGTATIELAGATGLTSQQSDVPIYVNVTDPAPPGGRPLDVQIGFDQPAVYTGATQSLTLYLINRGQQPLVPGGAPAWGARPPTFELTFAYGDGPGALTSIARAAQLAMTISAEYGNAWQPPQLHDQGQSPYWTMQPDPGGGGTVLGSGENAAVEFVISGIDVALPAGLDSALTVAYVSWHDIPGYDDGSSAIVLTKRAGPSIVTFTASPASVPANQQSVQSVLTWDAAHASHVTFTAPGVNPAQMFLPSGSGPVKGGITVGKAATLTITAYAGQLSVTASVDITGASRTDVSTGTDYLGLIVAPPGSASVFAFQARIWTSLGQIAMTEVVVIDPATRTVTKTLDYSSLLPPPQDMWHTTVTRCVAASPDGSKIHVLAEQTPGQGQGQFYLLSLDVAALTWGPLVTLGSPQSDIDDQHLIATADGKTVYLSDSYLPGGKLEIRALDASSYAVKGSWSNDDQWLTHPIASNQDGSVLLVFGQQILAIFDVPTGFSQIASWQLPDPFIVDSEPVVSADASRVYWVARGLGMTSDALHLMAFDVDLAAGSLTLAKDLVIGPFAGHINLGAAALSPDDRTLYVLTALDVVTAYDTRAWSAVQYQCDTSGQFAPQAIACTQPDVLYTTANDGSADLDIMSIITLS